MNKQLISKITIYIGILFCFMFDIFIYNLFNQYLVNSLLCYLIIKNLTKKVSLNQNLFAIFFLLLESFLHYGIVGLDLGLFVILIIIINKTKIIVKHHYLLIFILISGYFFSKFLILETLILGHHYKIKSMFLSVILNYLITSFFLMFSNYNRSLNQRLK